MSSFYGGGGGVVQGISAGEARAIAEEAANNHIIFSKTEPTVQKVGDIWIVIGEFEDNEENNGN